MKKILENLPKIQILPKVWKKLPEVAGIYAYFNENKVIYIGKAKNLKRRVASYFDIDLEPKTARMISEATHISYIQVDSELAALLLEAKLIRNYMPHFNIVAKDDKHPLYIVITKENFPRIISVRKLSLESKNSIAIYGPFPSSANVRSVLRLIRKIFPYSDHKITNRACIYSHIGLCSPCPSEITRITNYELRNINIKKYKANIKKAKQILDGKISLLTKNLEKEMRADSNKQNYESAAHIRNQITQIEYITRPQLPTEFYIENPNLYYDQRKKELKSLFDLIHSTNIRNNNLKRIECFDIAHLAGTHPTASMVTFIDGEADKKYYRHFKIRQKNSQNDFDSMEEVARRRFNHLSDWGTPDLILVDGSVGQIIKFKNIIKNIPIVGIAKHPDRLILTPDKSDNIKISDKPEKIILTGTALNFVSRIRDEAHRFARRLHHKLVSKAITNPDLD